MGGRLRKFKKAHGSDILVDKKKLAGAGRLNEKIISKLQNYYGLAIRQNTHSLLSMGSAAVKLPEVKHDICSMTLTQSGVRCGMPKFTSSSL